jgi:phosphocarrier protein
VIVYEASVTVTNTPGIHARPAALMVQEASRFAAEITIATEHLTVNGKSIMGVMMLAAETGTVLTVRAEGDDAREAVESLVSLIASGFKEK